MTTTDAMGGSSLFRTVSGIPVPRNPYDIVEEQRRRLFATPDFVGPVPGPPPTEQIIVAEPAPTPPAPPDPNEGKELWELEEYGPESDENYRARVNRSRESLEGQFSSNKDRLMAEADYRATESQRRAREVQDSQSSGVYGLFGGPQVERERTFAGENPQPTREADLEGLSRGEANVIYRDQGRLDRSGPARDVAQRDTDRAGRVSRTESPKWNRVDKAPQYKPVVRLDEATKNKLPPEEAAKADLEAERTNLANYRLLARQRPDDPEVQKKLKEAQLKVRAQQAQYQRIRNDNAQLYRDQQEERAREKIMFDLQVEKEKKDIRGGGVASGGSRSGGGSAGSGGGSSKSMEQSRVGQVPGLPKGFRYEMTRDEAEELRKQLKISNQTMGNASRRLMKFIRTRRQG